MGGKSKYIRILYKRASLLLIEDYISQNYDLARH